MKQLKLKKIFESLTGRNNLIKALMNDDQTKAMQAMSNVKNDDLQLTFSEFNKLAKSVKDGNLDAARKMLDVEQDVGQMKDTSKFNPMTGQPWKQGPAQKQSQQQSTSQAAMTDRDYDLVMQAIDRFQIFQEQNDGMEDFAEAYDFSPHNTADDLLDFLDFYDPKKHGDFVDYLVKAKGLQSSDIEEFANLVFAVSNDPSALPPDEMKKYEQSVKKFSDYLEQYAPVKF